MSNEKIDINNIPKVYLDSPRGKIFFPLLDRITKEYGQILRKLIIRKTKHSKSAGNFYEAIFCSNDCKVTIETCSEIQLSVKARKVASIRSYSDKYNEFHLNIKCESQTHPYCTNDDNFAGHERCLLMIEKVLTYGEEAND